MNIIDTLAVMIHNIEHGVTYNEQEYLHVLKTSLKSLDDVIKYATNTDTITWFDYDNIRAKMGIY